jgi:hypothetical protein
MCTRQSVGNRTEDRRPLPATPGANQAANVLTPAHVPNTPTNVPVSNTDRSKASKDLAVANYTSQIDLAMQGLANVMRDA